MNLYERKFEENNKNPLAWRNKSSDLFKSAHVLWDAMDNNNDLFYCLSPYKMLMGMSFELLFKAICIQREVEFKHSHNLFNLSQSANVSLTKEEVSILKILTEYIVWDGKYPNPKGKDNFEHHRQNENKVVSDHFNIGNLNLQRRNRKLDFEPLAKIWRKCEAAYVI